MSLLGSIGVFYLLPWKFGNFHKFNKLERWEKQSFVVVVHSKEKNTGDVNIVLG